MISRDYTQEVGMPSPKKLIPRPIAYVLLAIIAAGVFFGMSVVIRETKQQHAAERAQDAAESAGATSAPAATPATAAASTAAAPTPAAASEPAEKK